MPIVLGIHADDKATPVVKSLKEEVKTFGDTASQSLNGASASSGFLGMSFTDLHSSVKLLELAFNLVKDAVEQAFEFAEEGASVLRLRDSFDQVATSAGVSSDAILEALRKASNGTISNTDLMLTANKAMMLGVTSDAEEMATLLEIAAVRGRAMGLTTQKAFDDIARGLGRASPLILDNLGIIVDSKANYEAYAQSIGKSADELTKAEKGQALLTAVLIDGKRILAETGGVVDDDKSKFERFNAEVKNTSDAFAADLAPVMARVAEMGADLAVAVNKNRESWMEWHLFGITPVLNTFKDWIMLNVASLNKKEADSVAAVSAEYSKLGATVTATGQTVVMTNEEMEEAAKRLSDGYKAELSAMLSIQQETDAYAEKSSSLQAKLTELNVKIAEATEKYGAQSEQVGELRQKYADTNTEIGKLAKDHELATAKMVYNNILNKLSVDGLSTAEFELAQKIGVSLGIFSQATADQAIKMNTLADAVVEGKLRVEDLGTAIDILPEGKSIDILLNALTDFTGIGVPTTPPPVRAFGGPVTAGETYRVGERGEELFRPKVNGDIIPNSGLSGGSTGSQQIQFVYAPLISTNDRNTFTDFVLDSVRRLQADGAL